jgi:hypothetical protein
MGYILAAKPALAAGTRNELDPRALPIAPEAMAIWQGFFDGVEAECGVDGQFAIIQDVAAKAAENAARIAGVITVIEDLDAQKIGADAMQYGVALAGWYLNEALRLAQGAAPIRSCAARTLS